MRFRIASLAVVAALVAVACGDTSQVVATVDGDDITAHYMASLRESYGQTINVNTEEFRNELSQNIIRLAIVHQAEEQFGITVTDEEIASRITDPPLRWRALFAELEADTDTTAAFAESQAQLSILRDRVTAELIRGEAGYIQSVLDDSPQELTAGCVRHVLVGSQLEAEAVIQRIETGEDFATVAADVTLDTASGGDVIGGCPVGFGGFVPEFAAAAATAPLNQPVGPVQTQFGFHVIRVEERIGPPTLEELQADPVRYLPGATLSGFFTPWFNEAVRESDISVATAVGRWSPTGVGILPPGQ